MGCAPGIGATRVDGVGTPIISEGIGKRGLDGIGRLCTTRVGRTCLGILPTPASLTRCLIKGLTVGAHPHVFAELDFVAEIVGVGVGGGGLEGGGDTDTGCGIGRGVERGGAGALLVEKFWVADQAPVAPLLSKKRIRQ